MLAYPTPMLFEISFHHVEHIEILGKDDNLLTAVAQSLVETRQRGPIFPIYAFEIRYIAW